jgi:hypothetical protein
MDRNLIVAVALVVAVGALLFPTVAAPWTDEAPELDGVVIEPSDGPNGVYAVEDDTGQLAIHIDGDNPALADGEGVSNGAVTTIPNVFTITNGGDQPVSVWIETDIADVEFVRGTDSVESIGPGNSVTLATDDSVHVGVRIHAVGDHDIEHIESFEVVAEHVSDADGGGETAPLPGPDGENSLDSSPDGDKADSPPGREPLPPSNDDDATNDTSVDGDEQQSDDEQSGDNGQQEGDEQSDGDEELSDSEGDQPSDDGEVQQPEEGENDPSPGNPQEDPQSPGSDVNEPDGGEEEQTDGGSTGGAAESDQTPPTLAGAVMNTLALLLLALFVGIFLFGVARRRTDDA